MIREDKEDEIASRPKSCSRQVSFSVTAEEKNDEEEEDHEVDEDGKVDKNNEQEENDQGNEKTDVEVNDYGEADDVSEDGNYGEDDDKNDEEDSEDECYDFSDFDYLGKYSKCAHLTYKYTHEDWKTKKTKTDLVRLKEANLYHINELFIKPLTKNRECSFVELVAESDEQEPTWFVSHWWGTPFLDTLRMLKLHAQKRNVSFTDEYYWICAFASNQHHLDELNPDDYLATPFAKAIMGQKCKGSVALFNTNGEYHYVPPAMTFTRSWCVFESFVAIEHAKAEKQYLLDFATILSEEDTNDCRCASLLYELEPEDDSDGSDFRKVGHTSDVYGNNTEYYPLTLAELGVQVTIQKAEASQPSDQANISAWVGDRSDKINHVLRRQFVRPAMKSVCNQTGNFELLREVLEGGFVTKEEAKVIADEECCIGDACFQQSEYIYSYNEFQVRSFYDCFKYLLKLGCNPNMQRSDPYCGDQLPLEIALENDLYEFAEILLSNEKTDVKELSPSCVTDDCPDYIQDMLRTKGFCLSG